MSLIFGVLQLKLLDIVPSLQITEKSMFSFSQLFYVEVAQHSLVVFCEQIRQEINGVTDENFE